MADKPTVTHYIDQSLRYDHAMLDELIEVTDEWDEIPEAELVSWTMDWHQFAYEKMNQITEDFASGHMTSEQEQKYRKLIQRIEQHRKADLTVQVVDSRGTPIPDAQVHLQMKRHTFGFGTAVPAGWINSQSANGVTFREKLLENFNQVVFENDLKWPAWEGHFGPNIGQPHIMPALEWLERETAG
jgi:hypothetical protein